MTTELIGQLADGPRYRFPDWPNADVPDWRAGVYTVWDDNAALIYVGMAGRDLTAGAHQTEAARASRRTRGLRDRPGSHASRWRRGDQFNLHVFDRLVLPTLSADLVKAAVAGELSLDPLTRRHIHDHLAYQAR